MNQATSEKRSKAAPVFIMLAAVLWGSTGIFIRALEDDGFASMEMVFLRASIAMLVMGGYLLLYNRKGFRVSLKDLWCFAGSGVISIVFFSYCYFTTMQNADLSVAAVLLYTAPAFVTVLSILFFREKANLSKWVALSMALLGSVFVSGLLGSEVSLEVSVIMTGLGSGIGYALYSIFGKYAGLRGYASITITFYTFFFAVLGCLPFVRLGHLVQVVERNPKALLLVIGMAMVTTVGAYTFYTLGLSGMEAGKASILACVEPVTATMVGVVIFQEMPSLSTGIGILLVLGSTVVVQLPMKRSKRRRQIEK